MKVRRFLSALLLGAGCSAAFAGLLSIVLPRVPNDRLQLILSSFQLESTRPLVDWMNKSICFSLAHGWQIFAIGLPAVLAGAALLSRFTPSVSAAPPPIRPSKPETNDQVPSEPKPNPFAVPVYHEPVSQPFASVSFHSKPILEPNRITPSEETYTDQRIPYYSPRYASETQAIETTTGTPSQSGHYILIRPTPEIIFEEENIYARPLTQTSKPEFPAETTAAPDESLLKPASSLRIRSTMGRHDSVNGKIPLSRS